MNSRIKNNSKIDRYNITIDGFIERLKKIRALNCSASDIGMDNYVWKWIVLNRPDGFKKIL